MFLGTAASAVGCAEIFRPVEKKSRKLRDRGTKMRPHRRASPILPRGARLKIAPVGRGPRQASLASGFSLCCKSSNGTG